MRENVVVREGLNLTLDLRLKVGSAAETVLVVGDSPLLESKPAAQAVNIDGDLQRALPLSSLRTWTDFLLLTPGIAATQARFQTYSLHGTAPASGVYLVDGADAGLVLRGSTIYAQYSRETFDDIQIRTGTIDAATPIDGPVVSVATRSGTDTVHGSIDRQITRSPNDPIRDRKVLHTNRQRRRAQTCVKSKTLIAAKDDLLPNL